ncbi:hypothetical protein E5676_scaffold477G00770 [Cucumis melo var. makuwa]|uniref:Protein MNN4-like n=1 Tax=Cucumis melo var. makuwa TaxID=1194695 RepID=A0A5D3CUD3_CUCMM|nr:hypothetical protein E6C27_scaffold795G00880 [Cucumis melo var. makuwa]TYK15491.1 hypothetical protein E5676_scaffold477G00770 [Cucumis melo var. makuwa]
MVKKTQEKTERNKEEKILGKVEKVAQSAEKGKGKEMMFDEHCEEFEKKIESLTHDRERALSIPRNHAKVPRGTHSSVQMEEIFPRGDHNKIQRSDKFYKGNINEEERYNMVKEQKVKHSRGARPFLHLIEKLCFKACPALDQLPQVEVKDKVEKLDDEDEIEEDDVPLKRKRQDEEEASGLNRAKSSKAKDSKETLSPVSTKSPNKKKLTDLPSPDKSKSSKATSSQTVTKSKLPPSPKNPNRQPQPKKSKIPLPLPGKILITTLPLLYKIRKEP